MSNDNDEGSKRPLEESQTPPERTKNGELSQLPPERTNRPSIKAQIEPERTPPVQSTLPPEQIPSEGQQQSDQAESASTNNHN